MVPSGWMTPDTACTIKPSCSTAIMPCSMGPGGTAPGTCVWIKIGNGTSSAEGSPLDSTAPASHDHQGIRAPPVASGRVPRLYCQRKRPVGKAEKTRQYGTVQKLAREGDL